MGRWLSSDPAGYVNGLSLHQYVGSVPIELVDPSGLKFALCYPHAHSFGDTINGWTIRVDVHKKKPGVCYCKTAIVPCLFEVQAGVGWINKSGRVVSLADLGEKDLPKAERTSETEKGDIWREWHGTDEEINENTGDLDWESDSGDLDARPVETCDGSSKGGLTNKTDCPHEKKREEKFGKWSGTEGKTHRRTSQPQARYVVECGAPPRAAHLRLRSPKGQILNPPRNGKFQVKSSDITLNAWLHLVCGGCGDKQFKDVY
jgi:hypothetical protein